MTLPRGLICDQLLEQASWKDYHGLKQFPERTGGGSVMLHCCDKTHLPLLVFPFTFLIDDMNQLFISLLVFFPPLRIVE